MLVAAGHWKHVAWPVAGTRRGGSHQGRGLALAKKAGLMPDVDLRALRHQEQRRAHADGDEPGSALDPCMLLKTADVVRDMAARIDAPLEDWMEWEAVVKWLSDAHGTLSQQNNLEKVGRTWRYQMLYLCHCVMLGSHLRGMAGLQVAMGAALRAALPASLCEQMLSTVRASTVPSQSTVQRHRLTLHCALMLLFRERRSLVDEVVTYHTMDSSPQGHRDYLCARVIAVRLSDLIDAMDGAEWMELAWRTSGPLDISDEDAALMLRLLSWMQKTLELETCIHPRLLHSNWHCTEAMGSVTNDKGNWQ